MLLRLPGFLFKRGHANSIEEIGTDIFAIGVAARGVKLEEPGAWEPYCKRDLVRSGKVTVHGKGALEGGLTRSTYFGTAAMVPG